MISKMNDNEYSFIIADLMVTLDGLKDFVVKFWICGRELPFIFDEESDFCFMQEGIRIEKDNRVNYIFYDSIDNVQVLKGESNEN